MAQYLLGIDNGCTVSKAALFTMTGQEVAVASKQNTVQAPHQGWQERDMNEMWQQTAAAIREVIETAAIDASDIAAVACTGHGNGIYLLNKQGQPLRPAIISTDARARAIIETWGGAGLDQQVRPKTMQSIWPAQPNALLAWLYEHEAETMKHAGAVLMAKDFIRYQLTGKIQAELTDFSGTSLMNLQTRDYDDELLKDFGISQARELLPPIVRTAECCGEVTAAAAEQTGLAVGTPVAGGMFDIDACGLSCGMVDDSVLCMVVGTWGNNQYISKTPVTSPDVFMTSCYSMDDYYLMLEGSATSGSNLEWFVNTFMAAERTQAQAEGGSVYEIVNAEVAAVKPQDNKVTFLPFLYGSHANPDAKATLVGMDAWQGRGHVLQAMFEGVVFGHKTHVERLLQFRSMPDAIRLTGGAARSEVWLQVFADVFQVPIQVPDGTELGALGAAIAAGVAAGSFDSYEAAVKSMVHLNRTVEPQTGNKELYSEKYERYRNLRDTLNPLW